MNKLVIRGKTPLDYAKEACDMMMRRWAPEDLPPKGKFHYHQGVFLSGMEKTYRLCGDERYFDYIKAWADSVIDYKGEILDFNPGMLDDLQPAILLFPLLARTGDVRYQMALETVAHYMVNNPKCQNGGFWHKAWYRQQMWLDGLYMAGPFLAEYGAKNHHPELILEDVRQAEIMEQVTRDDKTGLWYHAWSENKLVEWADPETGRSAEFWGRSMGWVPVALLDELDFIPIEMAEERKALARIAVDLLKALLPYQTESGMWYQVVDKVDDPANWPETSCTCLYVAGLMKAVRLGLMDDSVLEAAKKGYEAVINQLTYDENGVQIGGVCIGTAVGDYDHYIHRPTSINDLHGVGAYLIMCEEVAQTLEA